MKFLEPEAFFDLSAFEHHALFAQCNYIWEALTHLPEYLQQQLKPNVGSIGRFGEPLPQTLVLWRGEVWREGFQLLGGDVTKGTFRVKIQGEETTQAAVLCAGAVLWDDRIFLGEGALVEPGALIKGPAFIGAGTEVRQGAYIRGKCIIGKRCVVGHTTEMKSSIMLDDAKAGHFAYIGDSVLGGDSNLGAGTKLANLKITGTGVQVKIGTSIVDTGLRKLGAILGDGVQIGCNAVTNPGTLLSKACMVLPLASVAPGYYEPRSNVGTTR